MLEMIGEEAPPTMTPDMIIPGREAMAAMPSLSDEALARGGAYTVEERRVPGPDGAPDITLLICRPTAASAAVGAIYYTHGAGMFMGDRRMGLDWVLDMAAPLRLAVVSVEYRLAPEHPDPAPVEDCYAGLAWTSRHAAELGIDPGRIVICGRSAGGGLAAGVALLARDRGGPALFGQLLDCPMIDDRNDTVSSVQIDGIGVWDRTSNQTGWDALLGNRRGGGDVSSYAAPARESDLSGLPPAYIAVGSAEVFRDESVAYASRIWQCGGVAELHVWPGGFHGFDVIAPQAALSQSATLARSALAPTFDGCLTRPRAAERRAPLLPRSTRDVRAPARIVWSPNGPRPFDLLDVVGEEVVDPCQFEHSAHDPGRVHDPKCDSKLGRFLARRQQGPDACGVEEGGSLHVHRDAGDARDSESRAERLVQGVGACHADVDAALPPAIKRSGPPALSQALRRQRNLSPTDGKANAADDFRQRPTI